MGASLQFAMLPANFLPDGRVADYVDTGAWSKKAIHEAGYYETAFRVLGRYMDEQKPKDVFFFEQGGAFVVRLLMAGQQGNHHELSEFTKEDIESLVTQGPALRVPAKKEAKK